METWYKHTECLLKIQEANCATNKCVESSNQYVSVFSSPINSADLGPSLHLPMEDIDVNIFGVTKLLCNLVIKSHKATYPDSVPAGLLKEIAEEVAPAVSLILQAALDHCRIPFLLGKGTDLPDILGNETDLWNQTAPNLFLHHLL